MFLSEKELDDAIEDCLNQSEFEFDLSAPLTPEFAAAGRKLLKEQMIETVSLETSPIDDETQYRGKSRIGGRPDLQINQDWPRTNDEHNLPLPFIGQVNLEEVNQVRLQENALPKHGRLLFFYDHLNDEEVYGSDPKIFRVIWDQAPVESLELAEYPEDLVEAHREEFGDSEESAILLPAHLATPHWALRTLGEDSPELDQFLDDHEDELVDGMGDLFKEFYWGKAGPFPDTDWHRNQMLGVPICEQSDARGYVVNQDGKWGHPRDWVLLAQFGFDGLLEWGEGTIYFLIEKSKLAAQDFSDVRATFQQT